MQVSFDLVTQPPTLKRRWLDSSDAVSVNVGGLYVVSAAAAAAAVELK